MDQIFCTFRIFLIALFFFVADMFEARYAHRILLSLECYPTWARMGYKVDLAYHTNCTILI